MTEKQIVHAVTYVLLLVLLADIYINMRGNHMLVVISLVIYGITVLAINHIYDNEKHDKNNH